MSHHLTGIPYMKDTEDKSGQQNREEQVGPAFPNSSIIKEKNDKYPKYEPSVDESYKKLIQETAQAIIV